MFNETFCITAVEAAMCGNDLILPLANGPATTFKDFKQSVDMQTTAIGKLKPIADMLANSMISRIMQTHGSLMFMNQDVRIRQETYESICINYGIVDAEFVLESAERIISSIINYASKESKARRKAIRDYLMSNYAFEVTAKKFYNLLR